MARLQGCILLLCFALIGGSFLSFSLQIFFFDVLPGDMPWLLSPLRLLPLGLIAFGLAYMIPVPRDRNLIGRR